MSPSGRGPATTETARVGYHRCPVTRCTARVPADRLMCKPDWYAVPRALRDAVWRTWQNGQGAGTPAHTAAITAAVAAVDRKRAAA